MVVHAHTHSIFPVSSDAPHVDHVQHAGVFMLRATRETAATTLRARPAASRQFPIMVTVIGFNKKKKQEEARNILPLWVMEEGE